MGRPRIFDHDEAKKMYATGRFTIADVARRFGVSYPSVRRVVDPEWGARVDAARHAWMHAHYRRPCANGCGQLAWHQPGRRGLCVQCSAADRTLTVRETTLLCGECGEWKPDADFPRNHRSVTRRARHSVCRSCSTTTRQAYRERVKIPCTHCGEPCLPANEKHGGARKGVVRDTGLCARCYQATRVALTHCKRDHEFTPENTRIASNGYRACRTCQGERDRARRRSERSKATA